MVDALGFPKSRMQLWVQISKPGEVFTKSTDLYTFLLIMIMGQFAFNQNL